MVVVAQGERLGGLARLGAEARASAAALNVGRCSTTSWLTPSASRNAVTASMPCACVVLMTVVLPVANGHR